MMQFQRLTKWPIAETRGFRLVGVCALLGAAVLTAAGCGQSGAPVVGTASIISSNGENQAARPAEAARKSSVAKTADLTDKTRPAKPPSQPKLEKIAAASSFVAVVAPKPPKSKSTDQALAKVDDIRKHLVGKWRQNNTEKRTITVNADGTATILAELTDYRQYIVGKSLQFDLQWSLQDGTLTFITLGGSPPESIKYINAIYGKTHVYLIREFSRERMLPELKDTGEIEPEWTRISEETAAK